MNIVLYYAPNTCALAPYVTLTEANATFEVRPLNFRKGEQKSPDYLKLNPKHKVPLLVVDGRTLTENAAIHLWVHRNFPQTKLLPSDPWQEIQALSLHSWCASGLHPYLSRINSPARVCDVPGAEDSVRRLAAELLFEGYQVMDDLLADREFFFDHFTSVDAHFFWCFRSGTQFDLDLSRFKHASAHFQGMQTRPSVQKLFAYEKSVQAEFAKAA
jgi:glutathione S-transferase